MNTAARLERSLALAILRGERAPGSRLPSVRALAAERGVTVPTIQRVLDRLEALELITVTPGSGSVVRDPERSAGLSLIPLWFEALQDQPDRVARVFGDFLALRRLFAIHLAARGQHALRAVAPTLAAQAAVLLDPDLPLAERAQADLDFTRAVLEQGGNFAAVAVFNTVERLVHEVPGVAEALYGDPAAHAAVITAVAGLLVSGEGPLHLSAGLEETLGAWDAASVARYLGWLTRGPAPPPESAGP